MPDPNINKKVKINVVNRSGFDLSYHNLLTAPVGALVPLCCQEVIPNTRVNLRLALQASLPPLASDTFMKCQIKTEAFFVPYRLLYGGFQSWFTREKLYDYASPIAYRDPILPRIYCDDPGSVDTDITPYVTPGSLADYLGVKATGADITFIESAATVDIKLNIFPFLAYHYVYDTWYRNSVIQNPIFPRSFSNQPTVTALFSLSSLPHLATATQSRVDFNLASTFVDGVHLGDLRYRNFGADYFTSATPSPQKGNPQTMTLTVSGGTTSFTIASLRTLNSLQQLQERLNISGTKMVDVCRDVYGANLADGVAQRPLFLGHEVYDVYSKGVDVSAVTLTTTGQVNPFAGVPGSSNGKAFAVGSGTLIDDFTAQEPGCIMVIASLVPKATYGAGVNRQLYHFCGASVSGSDYHGDMGNPMLQNIGPQPIYRGELNFADFVTQSGSIFGYTDRYAEYMQRDDEVHGLLRDGSSLDSFALQRTFINGQTSIDSSFLAIPNTYLDQIAAAGFSISDYGAWIDSHIDLKISQPLARYCIPSLQDPAYEHGREIVVDKGGQHL